MYDETLNFAKKALEKKNELVFPYYGETLILFSNNGYVSTSTQVGISAYPKTKESVMETNTIFRKLKVV